MIPGGLYSSHKKDAEELKERQAAQQREQEKSRQQQTLATYKDMAKRMGTNTAKKFTGQWRKPF